jgi:hypothetical protein
MQVPQGFRANPCQSERRLRADTCIGHPRGYLHHHTASDFDVDDPTGGELFAVLHRQPSSMQRVPASVNLNFLPDMGRMNVR